MSSSHAIRSTHCVQVHTHARACGAHVHAYKHGGTALEASEARAVATTDAMRAETEALGAEVAALSARGEERAAEVGSMLGNVRSALMNELMADAEWRLLQSQVCLIQGSWATLAVAVRWVGLRVSPVFQFWLRTQ